MPPIILPAGIVLDLHDAGAQQLQAHAKHLGLAHIQVFRARRIGKEPTYLVVERPRPVFHHESLDVVIAHLDAMAQEQRSNKQ